MSAWGPSGVCSSSSSILGQARGPCAAFVLDMDTLGQACRAADGLHLREGGIQRCMQHAAPRCGTWWHCMTVLWGAAWLHLYSTYSDERLGAFKGVSVQSHASGSSWMAAMTAVVSSLRRAHGLSSGTNSNSNSMLGLSHGSALARHLRFRDHGKCGHCWPGCCRASTACDDVPVPPCSCRHRRLWCAGPCASTQRATQQQHPRMARIRNSSRAPTEARQAPQVATHTCRMGQQHTADPQGRTGTVHHLQRPMAALQGRTVVLLGLMVVQLVPAPGLLLLSS